MRRLEAGGADDQGGAVLGGAAGVVDGRVGQGEIEHHVGGLEQRARVLADGEAGGADAGERPRIATDRGMALVLAGGAENAARRRRHLARQRHAHAPGSAGDTDPDVRHFAFRRESPSAAS